MKLDDQVTSFELAKRLHELGVKQDSLYYWYFSNTEIGNDDRSLVTHKCSAFTIYELGKMLPSNLSETEKQGDVNILKRYRPLIINKEFKDYFIVAYGSGNNILWKTSSTKEANARALMVIYLIENKVIDIGELNDEF